MDFQVFDFFSLGYLDGRIGVGRFRRFSLESVRRIKIYLEEL